MGRDKWTLIRKRKNRRRKGNGNKRKTQQGEKKAIDKQHNCSPQDDRCTDNP